MNDHDVDHSAVCPGAACPDAGAASDLAHLQRISLAAHYLAEQRAFDRWDDMESWLAETKEIAQAERNLSAADTVIRIETPPGGKARRPAD